MRWNSSKVELIRFESQKIFPVTSYPEIICPATFQRGIFHQGCIFPATFCLRSFCPGTFWRFSLVPSHCAAWRHILSHYIAVFHCHTFSVTLYHAISQLCHAAPDGVTLCHEMQNTQIGVTWCHKVHENGPLCHYNNASRCVTIHHVTLSHKMWQVQLFDTLKQHSLLYTKPFHRFM